MVFQTVRGMRDFLPEKMVKKQYIEDTCRRVFERYGFKPIQTPAVESFELLSAKGGGGEEIKKEIYYFKDQGDRELGLRFDMTVPLARFVASNPQLSKPFKRYVIGEVWRYDRPQAKRYREFTQADVDVVGVESVKADFEVIAVAIDVFKELGFDFTVRVNNRKLLEEVALKSGIKKEQVVDAFRSLDKFDKISWNGVEKEFDEKKLNKTIIEVVKKNKLELVKGIENSEGYKELKELLDLCEKSGLDKIVKLDLSLARGLEYYTSSVFEVVSNDSVSLCGGGRYDKMISQFGGQDTASTGLSIGVDRVLDLIEEKLKLENLTKVFVVPVGENFDEANKLVQEIRRLGINAETDLMNRSLKKNLDYVNKQEIPFAIIFGEEETKSGKFKVKDMRLGKETEFSRKDLKQLTKLI